MEEQISLIKSTDYLIGMHGAGLSLSMFLPHNSFLHEVRHTKMIDVLCLMGALSGHRTYSEVLNNNVSSINGNQMVTFDEDDFVNHILQHMKENKFI